MAKPRNPNRDKAFEIYKNNHGKIKPAEIAKLLNEKVTNIRSWKNYDQWDKALGKNKKVGAPKGSSNAAGHGAPKENFNAVKHGGYISEDRFINGNLGKILPKTMINIMKELQHESPIEKLWRSILMQEARIVNMQRITYVKSKKDNTKELKKVSKGNTSSEEYEILFAHDKENSSISAMSKAMKTLADMIKQFEEMVNKDWYLISEEQRLKVELLKRKLSDNEEEKIEDDGFMDALKSEVDNVWD